MKLSLEKLTELSGFTKRTIRFYVQQGIVDAPTGKTRGAVYSIDHLERLLSIRRLITQGYSLNGIKNHIKNQDAQKIEPVRPGTLETWTKITINEGIEVLINGSRSNLSNDELREITNEIIFLSNKYSKEK